MTELSTVAPARSADEIIPEIARRLAVPGVDGCVSLNGPVSRQHCPVIAKLQSELAHSNRRSALSGLIVQNDRDLAALGAPNIANKDAAAIAHVLAALGFTVKADAINTVLMVLGVVILEIGGSLALATAHALRPVAVPVLKDITPTPAVEPVTPVAPKPVANVPAVVAEPVELTGAAKDVAARVEQLVREAGGTLRVRSRYALCKQLDATGRTLGRALDFGRVSVETDDAGLVLKVAA